MRFAVPNQPSETHELRLVTVIAAAGALLATAAALLVTSRPAVGDDADAGLEPIGVLVPDDDLDPRVLTLELDGHAYEQAVGSFERTLFDREESRRALERAETTVGDLSEAMQRLQQQRAEAERSFDRLSVELAQVERELALRAVERFVTHGADLDEEIDPRQATNHRRAELLSAEADDAQLARRRDLLQAVDDTLDRIEGLVEEVEAVVASRLGALEDRDRARLELAAAELAVDDASESVRRARLTARVAGTGIGVVAFDAYLHAEGAARRSDPGCELGWWMLAGVARVESRHGELGGRRLRADGVPDTPIVGVVLDGGPGVLLVEDTDGGRWDGDAEHDRAVGPLQFIPETWERHGVDGDGDGRVDPQDIHDAASTAARFLCAGDVDLTDPGALAAAYFRYNGSDAYVRAVSDHARRYATLVVPSAGTEARP